MAQGTVTYQIIDTHGSAKLPADRKMIMGTIVAPAGATDTSFTIALPELKKDDPIVLEPLTAKGAALPARWSAVTANGTITVTYTSTVRDGTEKFSFMAMATP